MKKRILWTALAAALLLSVLPVAASGFSDVAGSAWYYKSVAYASENGIVGGRGNGIFDPEGSLSVAEAVKLASGVFAKHNPDVPIPEQATSPWYDKYVTYAQSNGILKDVVYYLDSEVTRAQFAELIYAAVGKTEEINQISEGDIRDIETYAEFGEAVYSLYRAGILTGSDKYGRFYPERTLSRAEACTIIMRALVAEERQSVTLAGELGGDEIFDMAADAVFSVETFDANGATIRTGSGFFITSGGVAATNLHVLDGARSAKVTLQNGEVRDVLGVSAYSEESNTALLQIDGEDFVWLPVMSSDRAQVGQTVYSLGSPMGLSGTLSKGIISYVGRESDGRKYLQFTSSISQGSGGGALLDARGRVIGITSSSFAAGEALNLATPSIHILELTPGKLITLGDLAKSRA